jgi:hypothetical protein
MEGLGEQSRGAAGSTPRHRLLTRTRPRELAHRDSDPLELADAVLEHLRRIRKALPASLVAHDALGEACDLVKQLGVGARARTLSHRA